MMKKAFLLIGVLVLIALAAFYWMRTSFPPGSIDDMVPTVSPSPVSQGWKTYRNDALGVSFQYPEALHPVDRNEAVGFRMALRPQDMGSTGTFFDHEAKLVVGVQCVSPDNLGAELLAKPSVDLGDQNVRNRAGFEVRTVGEPLRKISVGPYQLFVFRQGCYECYESPEADNDGFSAFLCAIGTNRNNNPSMRCLEFLTERFPRESSQLSGLRDFFLNEFLPTVRVDAAFSNMGACPGLGEARG